MDYVDDRSSKSKPENTSGGEVEYEKIRRRSSILKPPKQRNPFSAIDGTEGVADNTINKARRVSFASSNYVKPFSADPEKNTIWDNTYEEEINHTDSKNSELIETTSCTMNYTETSTMTSTVFLQNTMEFTIAENHCNYSTTQSKAPISLISYAKQKKAEQEQNMTSTMTENSILVANKENVFSKTVFFDNASTMDFTINHNTTKHYLRNTNSTNKSVIFKEGDTKLGDMDMTLASNSQNFDTKLKENLNSKTVCFDSSGITMDFTSVISDNRRKSINRTDKTGQEYDIPNFESKENVNSRTVCFDNTGVTMDLTSVIPNFESKENVNLKTVCFDSSGITMDFTSVISDNRRKSINRTDKTGQEYDIPNFESKENVNSRTVCFDNTGVTMDLTSVISNVESKENLNSKTVCFDSSGISMDFTSVISDNRRKSINRTDKTDQEYDIPNFESKENVNSRTVCFDNTGVTMDLTSVIPNFESKENVNSKTVCFDSSGVTMDFTSVISDNRRKSNNRTDKTGQEYDIPNFESKENVNSRTVCFDNTGVTMDLTSVIPNFESKENVNSKTVCFDSSGVTMDFTSVISDNRRKSNNRTDKTGQEYATPNFESKENVNSKTVCFDSSGVTMDFTSVISDNKRKSINRTDKTMSGQTYDTPNFESKENLKSKTVCLDNTAVTMDSTSVISDNRRKSINRTDKTDQECDTPNFESKENINSKTVCFNNTGVAMDFTSVISDNKRKSINRTDKTMSGQECDTSKSKENVKSKTVCLDKTAVTMDFTSVISDKKRKSINRTDKTIASHEYTTPNFESKENVNSKTVCLDNSGVTMDFTSVISNNKRKSINNRNNKTVVFQEFDTILGDRDMTGSNLAITEDTNIGDMELTLNSPTSLKEPGVTTCPPAKLVENTTNKKLPLTGCDSKIGDMELTTNSQTLPIEANCRNKIQTKSSNDMLGTKVGDVESPILKKEPLASTNKSTTEDDKTAVFQNNSTVGDMEFTMNTEYRRLEHSIKHNIPFTLIQPMDISTIVPKDALMNDISCVNMAVRPLDKSTVPNDVIGKMDEFSISVIDSEDIKEMSNAKNENIDQSRSVLKTVNTTRDGKTPQTEESITETTPLRVEAAPRRSRSPTFIPIELDKSKGINLNLTTPQKSFTTLNNEGIKNTFSVATPKNKQEIMSHRSPMFIPLEKNNKLNHSKANLTKQFVSAKEKTPKKDKNLTANSSKYNVTETSMKETKEETLKYNESLENVVTPEDENKVYAEYSRNLNFAESVLESEELLNEEDNAVPSNKVVVTLKHSILKTPASSFYFDGSLDVHTGGYELLDTISSSQILTDSCLVTEECDNNGAHLPGETSPEGMNDTEYTNVFDLLSPKTQSLFDIENLKNCLKLYEFPYEEEIQRERREKSEKINRLQKQLRHLIKNFEFPKIEMVDLRELHKELLNENSNVSANDSSKHEVMDAKRPVSYDDIKRVSLHETIIEESSRSTFWTLEHVENEDSEYFIRTHFKMVTLKAVVDNESGHVYNIEIILNKIDSKVDYELKQLTLQKIFLPKLEDAHLLSALGSNYDLLTLLDFLNMTMEPIYNFCINFFKLREARPELWMDVDTDHNIILDLVDTDIGLWWNITAKIISLDAFGEVSVKSETYPPEISDQQIKTMAKNCPKAPDFLEHFMDQIFAHYQKVKSRLENED